MPVVYLLPEALEVNQGTALNSSLLALFQVLTRSARVTHIASKEKCMHHG